MCPSYNCLGDSLSRPLSMFLILDSLPRLLVINANTPLSLFVKSLYLNTLIIFSIYSSNNNCRYYQAQIATSHNAILTAPNQNLRVHTLMITLMTASLLNKYHINPTNQIPSIMTTNDPTKKGYIRLIKIMNLACI